MNKKVNFNELVTELPSWNNGRGISIESWIACKGCFEYAIAYAEIFWPDFVEFDGCILFAGFDKESYKGFLEQNKGDKTGTEQVMNHRHIVDFHTLEKEVTHIQLVQFGNKLFEMWKAKLNLDFPDKDIEIEFSLGSEDNLEGYEITFFQRSEEDNKKK